MSGFELIARVLSPTPPPYYVAKFWNGSQYEVLLSNDPDQPSNTWNFFKLVGPDDRFPYGFDVEPD